MSVAISSIIREIDILEQISTGGGIPGSLDARMHIYKVVCRSVDPRFSANESPEEFHVITSSCNNSIDKRTQRLSHGMGGLFNREL